jgi:hypothetical protein
VFPAVAARRRARSPILLVASVWLVALALLAAVAGLVVHQVRPQWLKSLEVRTSATGPAPEPSASGRAASSSSKSASGAGGAAAHGGTVHQTQAGANSATVSVAARSFEVLVSTQAPCWVQVTTPASFTPVFSAVMPGGAQQTFSSSNGQLTVQFGASKVTVQVRVGAKTVPGWQFSPGAVPFTLNFTSAASSG